MQSMSSATSARVTRSAFETGTAQADVVLLLARILLGAIFVISGWGKLMGLSAFAAGLQRNGVPAPDVMAVVGACVEFFGGVAIVLGLWSHFVALLMVAFAIVATLISHRFWEFEGAQRVAQQTNFMKNLAIMGGFLVLSVAGGGRLALDAVFGRR
jgi:putative oxidoreductase